MKKCGVGVVSLALLLGCASPEKKEIAVNTIEESELGYVDLDTIDKFVVKDALALKQFNKVIIFATQFDKLTLVESADKELIKSWNKSTWKEMDEICQQLDDFANKIFRDKGEFVPVTQGGDDVLALQFSLIRFMPYSNRYKDVGMDTVGIQSNHSGIGMVTVRGVLANAKSGELVAVIEETLEINPRTATMGNLATIFEGNNKAAQNLAWRTSFRRFIDNLHGELYKLKYARIVQSPQNS